MGFSNIMAGITGIYEDAETKIQEYVQDENEKIVEVGLTRDIMKDRLMFNQIVFMKRFFSADLNSINDFNCITEERRNELIKSANSLRNFYNYDKKGEDYFFKFLLYYVYSFKRTVPDDNNQRVNLSKKEKIILIIETMDPNFELYKFYLDLYNTYEEINGNQMITEGWEETVFNIIENKYGKIIKKFITMEKLYIERFKIDEEISLGKNIKK